MDFGVQGRGYEEGSVVVCRLMDETILSRIERSKREWEATFDAISDLIVIRDRERRVVKINRAFATALGSTPRDIVGQILDGLEGADHGEVLESPRLQLERGDVADLSGTFIVSKSPIPDMTGQADSEVTVLRDITALKQMEGNLRQTEKAASIQALAAAVAHEISNPIAIISGRATLLLAESGLDPDVRSVIEIIQRQVGRVMEMTRTLSELASPKTGARTTTYIETVIDEVLTLMGYEFSRNRIRLVRQCTPLPPVQISPNQFVQVFINLFSNARDAMPDGGTLTIETSRLMRASEEYICISVRDTGMGIEPEHASTIFLPFFTTKGPGKGTGLGLPVTRSIIRDHGGDITVESIPGNGTTFHVELPLNSRKH